MRGHEASRSTTPAGARGPVPGRREGLRRPTALAGLALGVALLGGCQGGGPGPGPMPDDEPGQPTPATIMQVQGASHLSPLTGRRVVTEGIVTLAIDGGYYLQARPGDGRPETADGIFVSPAGGAAPGVGDSVRVTGTVVEAVPGGQETENLSVTRLEASEVEVLAGERELPATAVLGSGGRLPPEVRVIGDEELPVDLRDPSDVAASTFDPETDGIDFYESLEGMRVTVAGPVAVSPTSSFDDGASAEVFTLVEGGAHITPDGARTRAGGILLQPHPDNRGDQNPERIQIQFQEGIYPAAAPAISVGDRLPDVTGVMSYGFGNFEVLATEAVEPRQGGASPEATDLAGAGDRVTVATYNVLNMNPLPETDARRARLGEHIAVAMGSPDVVALQEIQDGNGTRGGPGDTETDATATLRAVVDAIVAAGGPRYAFFDVPPEAGASGGVPGGNIRNAFLYDTTRVELVEGTSLDPAALRAAGVRDPDAFEGSRNPLVGVFSFRGRRFTVVDNHLTSRFGSTPIFGAVHPFVQAGEEERESQARALHDYVAGLLEEDPDARVVVCGDMNTFEFTDDLSTTLTGEAGSEILENLILKIPAEERYTYVFEGNSQALDHLFVTAGLRSGAEIDVVHVNADFVEDRAASDHDPVVARLLLP